MSHLIRIAVPCPLYRGFDYLCDTLPPIGGRVKISFGQRKAIGIVVEHLTQTDVPADKLKAISASLDQQSLFPADLFPLLRWIASYYHHPLGDVFATAMPSALRQGKACELPQHPVWQLVGTTDAITSKRAIKQQQAVEALADGEKTQAELVAAGISTATLNTLAKKGVLAKRQRYAELPRLSTITRAVTLNLEQADVVYDIQQQADNFQVLLLQGVTGSGKTEVYIHSITEHLKHGKQALVLVPEIGLTPQLVERFQSQLSARILAYHSNVTDQQRLQAWAMIQQGAIDVVIGTRSAIFLPFTQLGIIIVDEEHDGSFKQMDGLRYHARDLAVRRGQLTKIPVVLGSATPSLESLYNVQQHRYKRLLLTQRAGNAKPPSYQLINMREERSCHGLSDALKKAITETIARNEQVLLFLNRRGFSPVYTCHDCAWMAKCMDCDAHLTLHQSPRYLHCHHCDKHYSVMPACPDCHSENLHSLGLGTQRIEQAVVDGFPDAKIVRLDRDVTRKKGAFDESVAKIHRGEAQLLIGTQMLAKGHHFPNVTLVGVINADSSFYSVNYRAIEQIGQLLLQVAGRAGRAEKPGRVLIQTYRPDNPFLKRLIEQGYDQFAQALLADRELAKLPPVEYAVLFRAEAKKADLAMQLLQQVKRAAEHTRYTGIRILGPTASSMERRAGWYRAQLLLQSEKRKNLHQLVDELIYTITQRKTVHNLRWSIDVDPRE